MKMRVRWTGVAALWLGLALAASFAPTQPVAQEQAGERASAGEQSKKERIGGETFWQRTTTDPVAFFTFWIAAFTLVLASSTIWMACRSSREMRLIQRAYVAVNPRGVKVINPTFEAIGDIQIRNVGRLPAANVRWAIWCEFSANDRKEEFPIDESKIEGGVTLPPGSCALQGSPQFVGKSMTYCSPNLYLYVWGIVRYQDGFRESRKTIFCHRYNCVNYDTVRRLINADAARVHRYGNDAT